MMSHPFRLLFCRISKREMREKGKAEKLRKEEGPITGICYVHSCWFFLVVRKWYLCLRWSVLVLNSSREQSFLSVLKDYLCDLDFKAFFLIYDSNWGCFVSSFVASHIMHLWTQRIPCPLKEGLCRKDLKHLWNWWPEQTARAWPLWTVCLSSGAGT